MCKKSNKIHNKQASPQEIYPSYKLTDYSSTNDSDRNRITLSQQTPPPPPPPLSTLPLSITSLSSSSSSSSTPSTFTSSQSSQPPPPPVPPTSTTVAELPAIKTKEDESENRSGSEIDYNISPSRNICLHVLDQEFLPDSARCQKPCTDLNNFTSNQTTSFSKRKPSQKTSSSLADNSDELCILIPNRSVCSTNNHFVDSKNGSLVCKDINNKQKVFCRGYSSIGVYGSTVTELTNIPLHFANDNSCYHAGDNNKDFNNEAPIRDNREEPTDNISENHTELDQHEELHQSRAIMLLLVLIFHSLFDGITLGLRKEVINVFTLMFALILHKCLVAFSLTLKLRETFTKRLWRVKLCLVLFSFISPFGAIIGGLLSNYGISQIFHKGISGFLTSISTGTFFYVTFIEILAPEMVNHKSGILQIVCILLGFTVMACLRIF
ncbi:protein zntD-like [Argonauta hians]